MALFYANKPPPPLILVNELPAEAELLAEALGVKAERKVEISRPTRGARRHLVDNALANAREALARRLAENASQRNLLEGVQTALSLEQVPQRIEVYDNSHLQGRNAYGAMIVAGPDGFMKSAYRKFSIAGEIAPGDDYAMMREVMSRRFVRAQKEDPDRERGQWPDLVMIDGGAGQLAAAESALADLGVADVALTSKDSDQLISGFVSDEVQSDGEPRTAVLVILTALGNHRNRSGAHHQHDGENDPVAAEPPQRH